MKILSHLELNKVGTVVVKLAQPNDISDIIRISKTTDRFRMSDFTDGVDIEELSFWISDSRALVIVTSVNDILVGYAYGFYISQKWFFFDAIVLLPEYRGLGIGMIMYNTLREKCKSRGIQLVQGLVTDDDRSELDYWIRQGFEPGKKCIWVEDWLEE